MIYVLLDEFNTIHSYAIRLSENQEFSDEWVHLNINDIDPDELVNNYKYENKKLIKLTEEERQKYLPKKIVPLEDRTLILEEGLKAVLRGDMQSLAYLLYPDDFRNEINKE